MSIEILESIEGYIEENSESQKLVPLRKQYKRFHFKEVSGWTKKGARSAKELHIGVEKPYTVKNRYELYKQPRYPHDPKLPNIYIPRHIPKGQKNNKKKHQVQGNLKELKAFNQFLKHNKLYTQSESELPTLKNELVKRNLDKKDFAIKPQNFTDKLVTVYRKEPFKGTESRRVHENHLESDIISVRSSERNIISIFGPKIQTLDEERQDGNLSDVLDDLENLSYLSFDRSSSPMLFDDIEEAFMLDPSTPAIKTSKIDEIGSSVKTINIQANKSNKVPYENKVHYINHQIKPHYDHPEESNLSIENIENNEHFPEDIEALSRILSENTDNAKEFNTDEEVLCDFKQEEDLRENMMEIPLKSSADAIALNIVSPQFQDTENSQRTEKEEEIHENVVIPPKILVNIHSEVSDIEHPQKNEPKPIEAYEDKISEIAEEEVLIRKETEDEINRQEEVKIVSENSTSKLQNQTPQEEAKFESKNINASNVPSHSTKEANQHENMKEKLQKLQEKISEIKVHFAKPKSPSNDPNLIESAPDQSNLSRNLKASVQIKSSKTPDAIAIETIPEKQPQQKTIDTNNQGRLSTEKSNDKNTEKLESESTLKSQRPKPTINISESSPSPLEETEHLKNLPISQSLPRSSGHISKSAEHSERKSLLESPKEVQISSEATSKTKSERPNRGKRAKKSRTLDLYKSNSNSPLMIEESPEFKTKAKPSIGKRKKNRYSVHVEPSEEENVIDFRRPKTKGKGKLKPPKTPQNSQNSSYRDTLSPLHRFFYNFSKSLFTTIYLYILNQKIEEKPDLPQLFQKLSELKLIKNSPQELDHRPPKLIINKKKEGRKLSLTPLIEQEEEEDSPDFYSADRKKYDTYKSTLAYELKNFHFMGKIAKEIIRTPEEPTEEIEVDLETLQEDVKAQLLELFKDKSFNIKDPIKFRHMEEPARMHIENSFIDTKFPFDKKMFESLAIKKRFIELGSFFLHKKMADEEFCVCEEDDLHSDERRSLNKNSLQKMVKREKALRQRKVLPVVRIGGKPALSFSNLHSQYLQKMRKSPEREEISKLGEVQENLKKHWDKLEKDKKDIEKYKKALIKTIE